MKSSTDAHTDVAGGKSSDLPPPQRWRLSYWIYAAIIPLSLYSLEAIKISLYHVAQSPNAGLLAQLAITFIVYGVWAFVPRLCWAAINRQMRTQKVNWEHILVRLSALGVILSAIHLFLFTIIMLALYATEAWLWEPIHILHKFGEVWLGFMGLWIMVYVIASGVILAKLHETQEKTAPTVRYEVRENGKTLSIPFEEIYWIKAAGNYVELHTARGVTMVRKTLAQIGKELKGNGFLKSHRSALINGHHVVAIKPHDDSSAFVIQLANDEEAPLSRRQLSSFKDLLKVTK